MKRSKLAHHRRYIGFRKFAATQPRAGAGGDVCRNRFANRHRGQHLAGSTGHPCPARDGAGARCEGAGPREAVANAGRAEAVSNFLVSAFGSPDPSKDGRTITIFEVLDRSAKELQGQFADDPRTKSDLFHAIGESYHGLGLDREAIPVLEQARQLRSQHTWPWSRRYTRDGQQTGLSL